MIPTNPTPSWSVRGLGNIFSGIFGGIPATGAIARTAANVRNGGRTPVAGIVHCITLTIILLVLMPLAALIPMTTLAAVLLIVAANMADWTSFSVSAKQRQKRCHCAGGNFPAHRIFRSCDRD